MATKNMAYDHAAYLARITAGAEAGPTASTQFVKYAAFTAMQAMSAQITVTTAGATAGTLYSILKISGTATSTLATSTLGTSAAGTTTNVALSTAAGGISLLQGDILSVLTSTDTAGKAAVSYELLVQPLANVTA